MRENPKPFEVYRHFKGNKYQILTLATDSEDGRVCVVYQAMYDDFKVYVRDLEMFMSETDVEKYPECSQKYRFEKVTAESVQEKKESAIDNPVSKENVRAEVEAETKLDPAVLEYLEADTVDARLNILASMHHRITDEMINTLAVVSDVEINEGPVEQRYQELKNCLLMKQKFEKKRY
jgi:hypothetical protein